MIGWTGQRRSVSAEAVARDRCACPSHHRPFRDVLAKRRPQGQMFRSTVEIVVALWCDERSSLPLQSRPISAWFYLSATAASTTYSGEVNATQIPSPVRLNRKPTASRSPSATPRHAQPARTSALGIGFHRLVKPVTPVSRNVTTHEEGAAAVTTSRRPGLCVHQTSAISPLCGINSDNRRTRSRGAGTGQQCLRQNPLPQPP